MAQIYDNIEINFEKGLKGIISNMGVKRVDFCVGYFNLRGWGIIDDFIDTLPGDTIYENDKKIKRICRLLIGMHHSETELIKMMYSHKNILPDAEYVQKCKLKIAQEFVQQLMLGVPSNKDEYALRHLSKQLKERKVCVKLYLKEPLHAKLYLAHRPDDNFNKIQAIMGSSNLTYAGLTKQGELNAEFADSDSAEKLARWFDDRWEDKFCIDITEELIKIIDESWASEKSIPPYYIYLKTAYHLSQDARTGIKEYTMPPEFKSNLFDFQQTAVKIAARHLNNDKRNGAMIGDVVGLGKTITACAIAKIYENNFGSSTLIICPANLQKMWEKYIRKYDLKADVMSMAKKIDVEVLRYYRLVIIDESHNLRNETGSRYQNIKKLVRYQDSKVLLLTATPYNKDFSDLSSQLKLFIDEDQDLGIRPESYIRKLGGERQFMQKHNDIFIRSIRAFEKSDELEDWNELMKLFLVRRTRTFIKENYAKTDASNGRKYLQFPDGTKSYFPDRVPKSIKFDTVPNDQYSRLYSQQMLDLMSDLKLPRYGLIKFYDETKAAEATPREKHMIENLSRAGQRMMGFCRSTFFKRIDSSGYSFLLTIYRHILRNAIYMYAIENKLDLPIGDENPLPDEIIDDNDSINIKVSDDDVEVANNQHTLLQIPTDIEVYKRKAKQYYTVLSQKKNIEWLKSTYFKRTLKQQLKKDCDTLIAMINLCGEWDSSNDPKVKCLYDMIMHRHKDDKVIIFTQYSDTANYLTKELENRGVKSIACATGASENPTELAERFSPNSNDKPNMPMEQQYRILVATDVLSEGQNLQDAHVIINFDLPWAIIRLIQRAGRVDRIGQNSEKIYCYSFFPAEGVEQIINLRRRLNDRINENAGVVGSDEIFFEGNEQNLRDMYNEKSNVLEDEDDNDVDLASQAYQIWKNATDANPKLKQIIPAMNDMVYSTKAVDEQEGVITYIRTYNDFDVLSMLDIDGNVITQSQQKILHSLACSADTKAEEILEKHHDLVTKAVNSVKSENVTIGGILGSRFSTKYRLITMLEDFYNQPADMFFTEDNRDELKWAIDDVYNYPLLEQTKTLLGRMLRNNSKSKDIADVVIDLRKNNQLCHIDKNKDIDKDPSIICSMGLRIIK